MDLWWICFHYNLSRKIIHTDVLPGMVKFDRVKLYTNKETAQKTENIPSFLLAPFQIFAIKEQNELHIL